MERKRAQRNAGQFSSGSFIAQNGVPDRIIVVIDRGLSVANGVANPREQPSGGGRLERARRGRRGRDGATRASRSDGSTRADRKCTASAPPCSDFDLSEY